MGRPSWTSALRTRRIALGFLPIAAITLNMGEAQMSHAGAANGVKNVVLVHGGFVDGSGWEGVYKILKKDGFTVTIVQNPTLSLAGDVAVAQRSLVALHCPPVLVGPSFGGARVTEGGNETTGRAAPFLTALV